MRQSALRAGQIVRLRRKAAVSINRREVLALLAGKAEYRLVLFLCPLADRGFGAARRL